MGTHQGRHATRDVDREVFGDDPRPPAILRDGAIQATTALDLMRENLVKRRECVPLDPPIVAGEFGLQEERLAERRRLVRDEGWPGGGVTERARLVVPELCNWERAQ